MDFQDVVRKRRMVRQFSDDPVSPDALERIIRTAQRMPSAGYSQGVEFVIVTDGATRRAIAALATSSADGAASIARVPVHVVICASPETYKSRYREHDKQRTRAAMSDDELWQVPYWYVDAGCAMMLALLAVVNEGLAASFIGVWRHDELKRLLGIPEEYLPIGLVLIGHRAPDERPQGSATTRPRRPLSEIAHRERW